MPLLGRAPRWRAGAEGERLLEGALPRPPNPHPITGRPCSEARLWHARGPLPRGSRHHFATWGLAVLAPCSVQAPVRISEQALRPTHDGDHGLEPSTTLNGAAGSSWSGLTSRRNKRNQQVIPALIGSEVTATLGSAMVNVTHSIDDRDQHAVELTPGQPSWARACIGFTTSTLVMIAASLLLSAI